MTAEPVLTKEGRSFDLENAEAPTSKKGGCKLALDLGFRQVLPEWKRMFSKDTVVRDLTSAASIFCVAVPLNLAISVASNVPPQVAMVTAGVSAIPAALFAGTTLAVTGPAAAMAVLIAQASAAYGLGGLACITFSVGVLQLLCGVTNVGWVTKLTPLAVIGGFTTGVGVIIGSGQLGKLLALPPASVDASVFELWYHIGSHIAESDVLSLGLGLATFAVVRLVPKLHPKAGGFAALVGVVTGTALSSIAMASEIGTVKVIGEMPPLDLVALFQLPDTSNVIEQLPTIILIFSLCSVESLLSCACLDKLRPTSFAYDSSQELIGQGLGNLTAGLFSGMPVTSVIARSALNVRSDGQTRLASLVHACLVLGGLALLGPALAIVPMPALAAVLLNTASGMLWTADAKNSIAVSSNDVFPYAMTVIGMLGLGLAEGVMVGLVGSLLFCGWHKKETVWFAYSEAGSTSAPSGSARYTAGGCLQN
jgi:carbonic anhydrase